MRRLYIAIQFLETDFSSSKVGHEWLKEIYFMGDEVISTYRGTLLLQWPITNAKVQTKFYKKSSYPKLQLIWR